MKLSDTSTGGAAQSDLTMSMADPRDRRRWLSGSALLIIDMVDTLTSPKSPYFRQETADLLPAIVECRTIAKELGIPSFFTWGGLLFHSHPSSKLTESQRGLWPGRASQVLHAGAEDEDLNPTNRISSELSIGESDTVIYKPRPSAFFGTNLAGQLLRARVNHLYVVGVMTSGCVRASVTDSFSYDVATTLLTDAVGDVDPVAHESNLRDLAKYATLSSVAEFRQLVS